MWGVVLLFGLWVVGGGGVWGWFGGGGWLVLLLGGVGLGWEIVVEGGGDGEDGFGFR